MLTKAQIKYIRSLTQQKFRNEYKVFIVEGEKMAGEWLSAGGKIEMIVAIAEWADANEHLIAAHKEAELVVLKESELDQVTTLQVPNKVLLVVPQPETAATTQGGWSLALDEIQDPGNMGTIIRIADWFGIGSIVCSPGCVDVYNPKVVQSAMGGHLRVRISQAELVPFLTKQDVPKIAAVLHGDNVYEVPRRAAGVLVIGNEARGISAPVMAACTDKVTIPRKGGAESLNAGVSAGILCALLLPC